MDILVYKPPITEKQLTRLKRFLSDLGLWWDEEIETFIILEEGREIIATGARQRNLLKCIGVAPIHQGEGHVATLISELVKDALRAGYTHLFIFTKPSSSPIFQSLGFYEIAATDSAALLENRRNGIADFVKGIKQPHQNDDIGCVVANCNPFTNGHSYLIEQAASRCGLLYLFILSEDRSMFSTVERMGMAKAGTAHVSNVMVVPTSDYIISSATFPDYFMKDRTLSTDINTELDLIIFVKKIALPLGIAKRFVGTEPLCQVTHAYNEQMKRILPKHGIGVEEMQRYEVNNQIVSASIVRKLLCERKLDEIRQMVPHTTYQILEKKVRD